MQTIWKTRLEIIDEQSIEIPKGSMVLSVGVQDGNLVVWWLVPDIGAVKAPRTVKIFGTGNSVPENLGRGDGAVFYGSHVAGIYVWHVWVI